MRRTLILLTSLLLAACADNAAQYSAAESKDVLAVRAEQEYFWRDELTLTLIASRAPDCQRRLLLAHAPAGDVDIALFATGENIWTLRMDTRFWQVDTQACTAQAVEAVPEMGPQLGTFKVEDDKLVFEAAGAQKPGPPAEVPSAAEPEAAAEPAAPAEAASSPAPPPPN